MGRTPTIPKWKGYFMAHEGKWYFAYRIENDTIYIEDVCHSQNMHESKEYKISNNNMKYIKTFSTEADLQTAWGGGVNLISPTYL